jgi:hypothetical protein
MSTDLQTSKGNRYFVLAMISFIGHTLVDIPTALLAAESVQLYGLALLRPHGEWSPSAKVSPTLEVSLPFVAHCWAFLRGPWYLPPCYLLSVWYTRLEIQVRITDFYVIGNASSGLAGLLAYEIKKMAGTDRLNR